MRSLLLILVLFVSFAVSAVPQVRNVKAFQQYPWGSKVYITYEVVGSIPASAESGKMPFLFVVATDKTTGRVYDEAFPMHLHGDIGDSIGLHKIVWDVSAQNVNIDSNNLTFTVAYCDEIYLVVDLSSGANSAYYPVSYLYAVPSEGWTDEYKTTKLVLRRIMPGSFMMGGQYDVTLTKPFYCGIFEVTQKQYQLVMDTNPSACKGDMRPVERLFYETIRGTSNGAKWPSSSRVDSSSFMGRLQDRTGINFDLPTEAQWEYACRAGTTSSYNNGGNSTKDLKLIGRYSGNQSDGKGGYSDAHTTVGSYLPNAWGLYDMHGNVWEWCIDWYGSLASGVTDPVGPSSGSFRMYRGGGFSGSASGCTSFNRPDFCPESAYNQFGFRLARTLSN